MNKIEPIADRLAAALTVLACYLADDCPHSDQIGEDDLDEALKSGRQALAAWDTWAVEHTLNQQALPLEPDPPGIVGRPLTCSVCGNAEPCSHDFDRLHADLAAFGASMGTQGCKEVIDLRKQKLIELRQKSSVLAGLAIRSAMETVCAWQQDDDGVFETQCGGYFAFTEGTIEDNRFRFCPYCGAPIDRQPTPRR